jgi:glycosyltransferase involved in cell wall biosynthesis
VSDAHRRPDRPQLSMFVSYIVATYNCADRVGVLNQTVRELSSVDCEFCISDGGSSDGTIASLVEAPNVRVLRSSPDGGIYDAWNQVIPMCSGEYIGFIGVDDQPTVAFLEAARAVYQSAESPPLLIYGDRILQRGRLRRTIRYGDTPRLLGDERPVFDIPHQAALNHKSLFDSRRFDGEFQLAGDLEFYVALRETIRAGGFRHIPIPQVIASEEGLSRSPRSFRIYAHEAERIEDLHGIRLGYSRTRQRLFSVFERLPRLFYLLKNLSWLVRHDRR